MTIFYRSIRILIALVILAGGLPLSLARGQETPEAGVSEQGVIEDTWNVDFVGQIGGASKAVAIQGTYAYLGVGLRSVVLDISNPASPVVIGKSLPMPEWHHIG